MNYILYIIGFLILIFLFYILDTYIANSSKREKDFKNRIGWSWFLFSITILALAYCISYFFIILFLLNIILNNIFKNEIWEIYKKIYNFIKK